MKKLLALCLAVILVFSLAACGAKEEAPASAPAAAPAAAPAEKAEAPAAEPGKYNVEGLDPVQLTLAHHSSPTEIDCLYIEDWMAAVTEASEGKITFSYHPGAELGGQAELIESLNLGVIDMGKVNPSMLTSICPEMGLLTLPYLFEDFDMMAEITDGEIGQAIVNLMEERTDTILLNWYWQGWRIFDTDVPLNSLDDCKGVVLRSAEASIYIDTFTKMGFSPTPLAMSEIYTAMQTGVVDGFDSTLQVILNGEYQKIAPYICASNHMICVNCLTINKDVWNSLPEVYQQIMKDALVDNTLEERVAAIELEKELYAQAEGAGATVTQLSNTPEEMTELFRDYWYEWAESVSPEAVELLDMIVELKEG